MSHLIWGRQRAIPQFGDAPALGQPRVRVVEAADLPPRRRALTLNLVSGASGLLGALVAYAAVQTVPAIRPFVLAFSAASLLYIAMSDLIPDLHRGQIDSNSMRQVVLIGAGIATIVVFERLVG